MLVVVSFLLSGCGTGVVGRWRVVSTSDMTLAELAEVSIEYQFFANGVLTVIRDYYGGGLRFSAMEWTSGGGRLLLYDRANTGVRASADAFYMYRISGRRLTLQNVIVAFGDDGESVDAYRILERIR